ncbi:MAG: M56 family metallopeptidase [Huintestinicola sp.]|uniref:M56 family metallopeptidase n=1 Tax=Huintestinicola sp. TaxID=2981661 RepID=UPI003EFC859D
MIRVIEAVISSSVLITIIILIRTFFKGKIKCSVLYSLWLVAAVRLMLPFELVNSSVSVMNVAEDILPQAIARESDNSAVVVLNESEPYIPEDVIERSREKEIPASEIEATEKFALKNTFVSLRRFITAVMLLWFGGVNILYSFTLRKSRKEFVYEAPLPVYTTPNLASPCIFGLFFPAIYIPEKSAEDDETVEYIIAHELCHYHHGDLIWTVLRYVLLSVYWFDPFVWAAAVLSKRDCECACDEAAIKMLGEERRYRYGKAIIDLIPLKRSESFGVASTSMASRKNVLKERMRFIATKPVNRISAVAVSAAAVIFAAGSTFTSAQDIEMPAEPVSPFAEEISETNETADDRISISVTDRNEDQHELIYFSAPDGYEPYIYMNEYVASEWNYPYHEEVFESFLDGSHFSSADVVFEAGNFTVNKWENTDAFDLICNSLKNKELSRADSFNMTEPISQVSFSRANGGFSSSLHIAIFIDGDKKVALMKGDDMNKLTQIVIDGNIPTEYELRQAYNNSVHFEAVFDGEELYNVIYALSGRGKNEEINIPSYPAFSSESFSENISDKLIVSGQIPRGFIRYSMGNIVFAVPYEGSVNEIGSTFLWQNGSRNFRLSSGKISVPDNAEEVSGEFCGKPCSLYLNDENAVLMFSDNEGKVYFASADFSSASERDNALKMLGSIHME